MEHKLVIAMLVFFLYTSSDILNYYWRKETKKNSWKCQNKQLVEHVIKTETFRTHMADSGEEVTDHFVPPEGRMSRDED